MTPEQLVTREDAAFYLSLVAVFTIVIALTLATYAMRVLWKYRDDHTPKPQAKHGKRRKPRLSTNKQIVMPTSHDTITVSVNTTPSKAIVSTRVMPQPSPIPGDIARRAPLGYGGLEVTEVRVRPTEYHS